MRKEKNLPMGDKATPQPHPLSPESSPPRSPQMYNLKFLDGLNRQIRPHAEPLPELPVELPELKIYRLEAENRRLERVVKELQRMHVDQSQWIEILLDENQRLKDQTLPPADQQ
ncbi:hypothetical protein [Rhizobacter sp. Root16D2]|nr:hypothetical protein [Rhizobacter sp. Root16D2]